MKFENKGRDTHVAFVTCAITDGYGRPRKISTAVRAVKERNGKWRADKTAVVAGTWLPWEPIVSTEFSSLTAAKKAIGSFAKACKTPGNFSGARRRRRR